MLSVGLKPRENSSLRNTWERRPNEAIARHACGEFCLTQPFCLLRTPRDDDIAAFCCAVMDAHLDVLGKVRPELLQHGTWLTHDARAISTLFVPVR
jgi:hypothetical protein